MLLQISIKNFAIFKDASLEPGSGYNVITGESGAGKSVIVNALSLICGERAYKDMIRTGEKCAIVEAVFRIPEQKKKLLREKYDIDSDLLVITREIHRDKPSICKINGKIRNLSLITEISSIFIDIHGQYENQTLMDINNHIKYLDDFAHDSLISVISKYKKVLKEYNYIINSIISVSGGEIDRERNRQILEFQIEEIDSAELDRIDEQKLLERKNILENSEKYINSTNQALEYLNQNGNIISDNIRNAAKVLESLPENENLKAIILNLNESFFTIQDSVADLSRFSESIEYDEIALEKLNDKIDVIRDLKRKYGATIEDIVKFRDKANIQLQKISNFKKDFAKNLEKLSDLEKQLLGYDESLTNIRKKASLKLIKLLLIELKEMGMNNSVIKIIFTKTESKNRLGFINFPIVGRDQCEFLVSLNKGLEPVTLGRVASGGEMSRIMLSFKTVFSYKDDTESVVFDEIDSGISGDASIAVAEKLSQLALDKQIICITHLPQIAARADEHFIIRKDINDEQTSASVKKINDRQSRIDVIASLTDGENVSEEGRKHAVKILNEYNKYFN